MSTWQIVALTAAITTLVIFCGSLAFAVFVLPRLLPRIWKWVTIRNAHRQIRAYKDPVIDREEQEIADRQSPDYHG